MPNLRAQLTASAFAALTLCSSAGALAQDGRWFRVELLVFANDARSPSADATIAEQWDPTPALAYPASTRFLVDTARVEENKREFDGESLLDEYGRQIITILTQPRLEATGAPADLPVVPAQMPQGQVPTAPPSKPSPLGPVYEGAPPANAPQPVAAMRAELPRPFVLLPPNYQEFQGKAALMQRSGGRTVLFHESWVQPVSAEADSIPIVLDHSGDTREWPRLQGTIRFFLSRYLQVETNLWMNTAGEYLPGTWRMPAPPFGPPSLVIEEEEPVDIAAVIDELPAEAELPVPAGATPAAASPQTGLPPGAVPGAESQEMQEVAAVPVYPYRHAVLLKQSRRMRSMEVHYIDHPLMGVIIKFTPVTTQELNTIAGAQAAVLQEGTQPL